MPDVLFYHLENQPLERVLPILLEKTLERRWRAVIEVGSSQWAEASDTALWTRHVPATNAAAARARIATASSPAYLDQLRETIRADPIQRA